VIDIDNNELQPTASASAASSPDFLQYGGELAERMRAFDWSTTSLGAPADWPPVLKMALRIVLNSSQPMFVWWGPELLNLYNDAYKSIIGARHPVALGQPAAQVWWEIWDTLQPRVVSAMQSCSGTYDESLLLIMERNGYPEETYYTFSYSPILDDDNIVRGIICANTDDTERIIGARQTSLLRELAAATADAKTFDEACSISMQALRSNSRDVPFALFYALQLPERNARLTGLAGIDAEHPLARAQIDLDDAALWPLAEVLRSQQPQIVTLPAALVDNLPCGPWPAPPQQCAVLPIGRRGAAESAGILIVGLNPFRRFDDNYRGFLELAVAQISAAFGNAQAYAEERQRAETLATLDRAKTAFFSNVSHEFRTPLALILGPLDELLQTDNSDSADSDRGERQQLMMMRRNAQRLLKLVNTLLDFSRIEAGRLSAFYQPMSLATYTEELAGVFREVIEQAGMQFNIDCPPLPEPVFVDAELWEKIVFNLLSNAFKYTFSGSITISLRATPESAVTLQVSDTGIGIAASDLPNIFTRFQRVENARGRTMEGSGIGLALVQELTKLHGGAVFANSEVGVGSTFSVTIPLGSAHLPAERIGPRPPSSDKNFEMDLQPFVNEALHWLPAAQLPAPAAAASAPNAAIDLDGVINTAASDATVAANAAQKSATVLLADDNADMRAYVRRVLSPHYHVIAAADGVAAFDMALAQTPDLIVTDVMMPRLDGFGLLEKLRAHPRTKTLPVIMLSARAGQEARIEGLQASADDYLMKPFSARELLARIEGALTVAHIRDTAAQRERDLRNEISVILESMDSAFVAFDGAFTVTYANAATERSSGLTRKELLNKNLWVLFPDAIGTEFEHQCRRVVTHRTSVYFEYFYPLWGRWYEINIVLMTNDKFGMYLHDITAQKSSETALQEMNSQLEHRVRERTAELAATNARFQAIYDQGLFSGLMTTSGILIDANRTSLESSGFSRADVIDKPLWETGWWNRSPQVQVWLRNGFAQAVAGVPFHGESVYFHADGAERIVDFAFIPIKGEDGELLFIVPTGLDITERRRAEQALQQAQAVRTSEDHFRSIFHHMVAGVAQTDDDGRFIWVNERFCDLVGRSAEQLYAMRLPDIVHAADIESNRQRFRTLADGAAESFIAELRYVRPDGTGVWVSNGVSTMQTGSDRRYVSIALDIGARMHAEATLLKQSEKLRLLWEAAAVLLSQDDPRQMLDGIFAKIAPQFGIDCYLNFMVDNSGSALQLVAATGIDDVTYHRLARVDFGSTISGWVALHRERYIATSMQESDAERDQLMRTLGVRAYVCSPLMVEDRLLGTLAFASRTRDSFDDEELEFLDTVTYYVTLAYDRWRLLEKMRENDRRKDEFLATLAHELRNPLAPLRNGLQIMRMSSDVSAIDGAKNMMERQLVQMVRLVDELLDLSRINLGKVQLHRERVELATVLQNALEVSRSAIDQAQQELVISIPAEPIFIEADITRLGQVFINLLNNASKYSAPGGRIDLIATCVDGEVMVVVKDNGIGIPAAHLPHVFEMFTHVQHRLEKSNSGLGIGLSIVKRLVEMHGGRVEVHSAGSGFGSEFIVRLRVLMTLASDHKPAQKVEHPALPSTRRKILVADDNVDAAASLAMLLELMGNEVAVAHDGQQACDIAPVFQPAIVILDIGMPKLNGYAACRLMRSQPWSANAIIIALTGWGQLEDKLRSEEAGFDRHLVKPIDPIVLGQLLSTTREGVKTGVEEQR
jgi:PAS domain S-box-containing protein